VNPGNQLVSLVFECEELVSNGFVEPGPLETVLIDSAIAESLTPIGSVAEPVDVLWLFLESESDQRIGGPVARKNPPDSASVCVEVPLPWRIEGFLVDLQGAAVPEVFLYGSNGLDRHD